MSQDTEQCVHCNRTSSEIPLLKMSYAGKQYWICPEGLPILIHKPYLLKEIAGAWNQGDALKPHEH